MSPKLETKEVSRLSLFKFVAKRLLAVIPVLLGVLVITFILSRLMPGDPALAVLPAKFTPSEYYAARQRLGLDDPLYVQFFIYIAGIFQGNWGNSVVVAPGTPVWILILQRFPRTLDISLLSILIATILGLKTGIISATNRNKPKDTVVRGVALVGVALPIFWLGLLLQYLFANPNVLNIIPAPGFKNIAYGDPPFVTGDRFIDSILSGHWDYFLDYLVHLILPVFCLSFTTLAIITRQVRASMLEILEQDYIRTARAKGCTEDTVINTHALRNGLIPTVTVIGMEFGGLLGGAILTELTFNLAGIGSLLQAAITGDDYWLLNAIVFFVTLLFIIVNLITDIIYGILDPRIRY